MCYLLCICIPINCLIIVHFSVFEMYSRCFDSVTGSQHRSKSINIVHHKLCASFRLSIGLLKAYFHYSCEPGYTEPNFSNWVEEGEIIITVQAHCFTLERVKYRWCESVSLKFIQ
jgi:hypothetical protein